MQRYDIVWGCGGACLTSIEESADGGYVQFEDVESLTAENERLRNENDRLEAENQRLNGGIGYGW